MAKLNNRTSHDSSFGNDSRPEGPLVIDLQSILRKRIPKKINRWIPSFLISGVAKLIRQDELNEILRVTYPSRGWKFSKAVLNHLGISVEVRGFDELPDNSRFMFASNHPLGGLDGIALIGVLGEKYGDEGIGFLVNDMLMNVEPLKDVFLPVNKFGSQGRDATQAINAAIASDRQILQFPAGLCSRKNKGGEIKDLEWQKSFVAKSIEYHRDIVPVYFQGRNSSLFYNTASWRKKLGLKFNVEQTLLPSELCKAKNSRFKITFGTPIPWQSLKESGKTAKQLATEIREAAYALQD